MLKRLELTGFKSFPQKTVLDFPQGVSVIVGPNGSGKSNIIDAIRWLLGEREAKNVRGAAADDLIFSGTDKKARVGMAQAALYLDNSKKTLPIDFSEAAIARKVYRDGAAEYLLNKSRVRLKDLVDFFARSGMGAKGLSVINQGGADAFVRAAPEERREMMEEILGLRQYQLKKREAELKLAGAGYNLEKSETAANELLPHLRLLRRQAGKWEKRAAFVKELADLENGYFTVKIRELEADRNKLDPELLELGQKINQKRNESRSLDLAIGKIESQKPAAGRDDRRLALQRELGQLEAQLKFLSADRRLKLNSQELAGLVKKIQRQIGQALASGNFSDWRVLLTDIDRQISNVFSGADGPTDERKTIEARINSLKKEIAAAESEEKIKRRLFESFNDSFRRALTAAADKREEIRQLESNRNRLLLEKDRWQYRRQDLEEKLNQAGRRAEEFGAVKLAGASFDFAEAERQMAKLKNELAIIGEIDRELIKEAGEAEERYQFLSAQMDDLRKAAADLDKLVKDLDFKIKNDFADYLKSVNGELDKHFKLLFNGGRARLAADEGRVDIDAVVPSKGVKNINAMSGGEKSLLAIAILFSLVSVNPPPFLVFDEIDAALDENNSRRFVELLKKFSQKIQFIIVTHNRSVMEAADALYGVTMDGNGVSKILSLKLGA